MNATEPISKYSDIIDSRDVIDRIEYLQAQPELEPEEHDELNALLALQNEMLADYTDEANWRHGITLIDDCYFKQYAMEFAEETGSYPLSHDNRWPYNCIDWDMAARELQYDYSRVRYWGRDFWFLSY